MKSNFWWMGCFGLATLFFFSGCAPTMLGDLQVTAKKPLLNPESYGNAKVTSKGDKLDVTLVFPNGEQCEGHFTLAGTTKSYVVFGTKSLVYSGEWISGQSAFCEKALDGPGGQVREITIAEEGLGSRAMSISNEKPGCLLCVKGRIYNIPIDD